MARALFIVITDYPGGAERISYGLASELASRRGWEAEVMVICTRAPDSFTARALDPRVRVRYGRLKNWYLAFPLLPFRLLFRRYDLVFTTHIYTNALLSALRRLRLMRIRRLVMRESMSLFDRYRGAKARLFTGLYRCYGGEDLLIAQTSYMAAHVAPRLASASVDRLQPVPNPVDANAISAASSEPLEPQLRDQLADRTNILFCGRFVDFKRPGVALDVFRRVAGDYDSLQMVFMGAGPLEEEVRSETVRAGLSHRVLFLGHRSNPYPVMKACQYGLLTSANEGFPNVVLEMMASGMRQIVMTPCAGDLDGLTGVRLSRSLSATDIEEALRAALSSGEDRSEAYRAVAASRSPSDYVDRVLGSSGA